MTTIEYGTGLETRVLGDQMNEMPLISTPQNNPASFLENSGSGKCYGECTDIACIGRCYKYPNQNGNSSTSLRPTLPKITANTASLLETYVSTIGAENVKPEETSLLTKLEALDLDPIKVKLMDAEEGYGWTREQADTAATAYKQFLFINAKYEGSSIVPTKLVDKVWHGHILDTEKYAEDSQEIFGSFLHHFPYFGLRGEEDAANLKSSFAETQDLFVENFGTPQLAGFDEASGCSGDHGICVNKCISKCVGICDRRP